MATHIVVTDEDATRIIRMRRPDKKNALTQDMYSAMSDAIDSALWSAVRVLEEHADLKARMARRAAERGLQTVAAGFVQGSDGARAQAERIRSIMVQPGPARAAGSRAPARRTTPPRGSTARGAAITAARSPSAIRRSKGNGWNADEHWASPIRPRP